MAQTNYWYKINGKPCTKAQYLAYKNKPGGVEAGKSTNDPDVSGNIAKTEKARANNKASKRPTVLTEAQTKIKGQGTKAPKKSPPFKWGWKDTIDAAQTGLTGLGMIPGVGNIADAVNTGVSGARMGYAKYKGDKAGVKKHRNNMAINAASMIPGAGLAVGGAKLAAKVVKGTKAANIANKAVKGAEKGEKMLATVYKGNKAGKVKNVTSKGRNVVDAVTSRTVVGKGKKGAYNVISGKTATKGGKVAGGVDSASTTVAQNKKSKPKTKAPIHARSWKPKTKTTRLSYSKNLA